LLPNDKYTRSFVKFIEYKAINLVKIFNPFQ